MNKIRNIFRLGDLYRYTKQYNINKLETIRKLNFNRNQLKDKYDNEQILRFQQNIKNEPKVLYSNHYRI